MKLFRHNDSFLGNGMLRITCLIDILNDYLIAIVLISLEGRDRLLILSIPLVAAAAADAL
jgi:hypothetical protein